MHFLTIFHAEDKRQVFSHLDVLQIKTHHILSDVFSALGQRAAEVCWWPAFCSWSWTNTAAGDAWTIRTQRLWITTTQIHMIETLTVIAFKMKVQVLYQSPWGWQSFHWCHYQWTSHRPPDYFLKWHCHRNFGKATVSWTEAAGSPLWRDWTLLAVHFAPYRSHINTWHLINHTGRRSRGEEEELIKQ